MLKKSNALFLLLTISFLLVAVKSVGQNLVPNGGFESFRYQYQYVYHGDTSFSTTPINCWVGANIRGFTYNHLQSPYTSPDNLTANTPSHSGLGYLTIEQSEIYNPSMLDSSFDKRTYAQTKLITPLISGQVYEIRLFVFASYNVPQTTAQLSFLQNLGIHFSPNRISDFTPFNFVFNWPYQVDFSTSTFVPNTWTELVVNYTASGGERYITLGNFDYFSDFNLYSGNPPLYPTHSIAPPTIGIDDISLIPLGSSDTINPNASLGPDTTICGDSINMTLTAASGFDQYIWNTGDTSQSIQITQPGTYSVNVNSECDLCNDTIVVSLQPPLSLDIGNDTLICGDDPFLLTIAPNHTDLTQYSWSNGTTTEQITVNQHGVFTLQADYACGTLYDTIEVVYQPKPESPIFVDSSICLNSGDYQVTALGTDLLWYDDDQNGNLLFGAPTYSSLNTDTFYVWVSQTINTCESDRFQIKTAVIDEPEFTLEDYALLCEFNEEKFGPREFSWSYIWNDYVDESPRVFDESGFYSLMASNQCGSHTESIEIEIEECPCTLFFPESFTPNGDGINDEFQGVYYCEFEEYEMAIFNRWGQQVFSSSDPTEFWSPNERDVQQAVYVLKYSYKGEDRERVEGVQKLVILK